MAMEFFVFPVDAFQFSKFYENETRHDKRNFDCYIQGHKCVKLLEILTKHFLNFFCVGK